MVSQRVSNGLELILKGFGMVPLPYWKGLGLPLCSISIHLKNEVWRISAAGWWCKCLRGVVVSIADLCETSVGRRRVRIPPGTVMLTPPPRRHLDHYPPILFL